MKVSITKDEAKSIVLRYLNNQFPGQNFNNVEFANGYSYSAEYCVVTHEEPEPVKPAAEEVAA